MGVDRGHELGFELLGLTAEVGQLLFALGDLLGHLPEAGLVDAGQDADALLHRGAALEVGRGEHEAAGFLASGHTAAGGEVRAAPGAGEGGGHVGGVVHVHHHGGLAGWAEHGELASVVRGDLEVQTGSPGSHRRHEGLHEAASLEGLEPGDHREATVEIEPERPPVGLQDHACQPHRSILGRLRRGLEGGPGEARPGIGAELGRILAPWHSCCPVPGALRAEHAPLAQSAERFHGKEKVDSSILSGGSPPVWLGLAGVLSA